MTLFEYVAVAASLICSFVAVRILGAIPLVLAPDRRYWVHAAWVFLLLVLLSIQWWIFWSYRDVEWTYWRFVLALAPLGLVYVVSSLVIPANADRITSWKAHFFGIRVRVFALALANIVVMVLCTVLLLGHPLLHPRRIVPGALSALFVVGMASDSEKVQGAITAAYVFLLLGVALVFARPETFSVAP